MDLQAFVLVRSFVMLGAMALALVTYLLIPRPRPFLFSIVGLITALALITESASFAMTFHHSNNNWIYNTFTLLELLLVLRMVEHERTTWRPWLVAGGALGIGAMAVNAWISSFLDVLLVDGIVAMSLIAALSVGALLWSMAMSSEVALHRVPSFWLCMGLLVYFSALPPVVLLAVTVGKEDPTLSVLLWTIMPVLSGLRYLLTILANRMQSRTPIAHG